MPILKPGRLKTPPAHSTNRLQDFFSDLGPGLITGCADDDPSGIGTYSAAGAAFGYGLLWTALVSFPMMCAVQLMCGRLGMVTGRGLAGAVRLHYSRWNYGFRSRARMRLFTLLMITLRASSL